MGIKIALYDTGKGIFGILKNVFVLIKKVCGT